jgi:hypothetical protein
LIVSIPIWLHSKDLSNNWEVSIPLGGEISMLTIFSPLKSFFPKRDFSFDGTESLTTCSGLISLAVMELIFVQAV